MAYHTRFRLYFTKKKKKIIYSRGNLFVALTWHLMIGTMMPLFRPLRLKRPLRSYPKTPRTLVVSLQWLSQRLCLSFLLFPPSPLHYQFLQEDSLFDLFLNSQSRQRKRNRAHRLLSPKEKHQHPQLQLNHPLKLFPRNRFTRVCFLTLLFQNLESNSNTLFLYNSSNFLFCCDG